MKRRYRLIPLLLLLSLLVSALPLFSFAASSSASDAKTAYDKLYIGSNGSTTQNGGTLKALFTAFAPNDPSVDMYEGTWYDKMGSNDAFVSGNDKTDRNPSGWYYLPGGGFTYDDPNAVDNGDNYISFSKGLLGTNFEVEVISAAKLRDFATPPESVAIPAPVENADGSKTYYLSGTTSWNTGVTATLRLSTTAGRAITLEHASGKTEKPTPQNQTKTTADANGIATVSITYRDRYLTIKVPVGVTLDEVILPVTSSTAEACATTSFVFGSLYMMTWTNLSGSNTFKNGFGLTRYYIASSAWTSTALEWKDKNTFASLDGKIVTLSVAREKGAYTVTHGGTVAFTSNRDKVKDYPADTAFRLFHNLPSEVYAVRVYSAPLTEAERNHNHLIDLLAYSETDPSLYTSLDYATRNTVASLAKDLAILPDKESVKKSLESIISGLSIGSDTDKLFYVTDGLVGLYTAYAEYSSISLEGATGHVWLNALNPAESITVYGNGWVKNDTGGFTIERTIDEWTADNSFGLRLNYEQLPENDYTVEFTVNPYGVHDYDENGNRIRYVDTQTQHGTYKQKGYILGPLRAMSFVTLRATGKDGQLEKRWVYLPSGCWNEWCAQQSATPLLNDHSWEPTAADEILNFSITLDETTNSSGTYRFYNNGDMFGTIALPTDKVSYIDRRNVSEKRFELFNHTPGTVYAVRIYNRVLSEAELIQNRAADVIYYYDLDTTLLSLLLEISDNPSAIYHSLSKLSFSMTKEEAQYAADAALTALLLPFEGNGIHLSYASSDRIRYYFGISEVLVAKLEAAGYKVDIGAIADVGASVAPTLDGNVTVVEAYNGSKNGFFIDDDTFAITVKYNHKGKADRDYYMTDLQLRGYIRLTSASGEVLTYYADPVNALNDRMSGIFPVYKQLSSKIKDEDLALHVKEILSLCCEEIVYTVGEGAYTLEEALTLAQAKMEAATAPLKVYIRLKEGEHSLSETVTLSGKDFSSTFAELIIESEGEGSTVSSLVDIDAADFEKISQNVYQYKFDTNSRPTFRYLYVDGKLATIATSGALFAASESQAHVAFDRSADGNFYLPASLLEPLRAEVTASSDPLTALSGKDVMMHIVAQWDYNMIHLLGVDFSDFKTDAKGEKHYKVYLDPKEKASFIIPVNNSVIGRPVYLTGSASFLDEDGEFHYNVKTGTLLYYSRDGIDGLRFSYPTLEALIVLDNITDTVIKDITFTGTDDYFLSKNGHTGGQSSRDSRFGDFPSRAPLKIMNCYGLSITDCSFLELPCEGITGRGRLENIVISGCTFDQIGSAALRLGSNTKTWSKQYGIDNVLITNNVFSNIALIYRASAALHFASARDLTVSYNTIHDCSYSAISAGWSWNSVSWSEEAVGDAPFVNLYNVHITNNYIYDFMTEMADGGAIYVLGGNADRTAESYYNSMRENYIVFTKHTGNGLGGMVCGIYLDAFSSHWELSENVIVEQSEEADVSGSVESTRRRGTYYVYLQHEAVKAPVYRVYCLNNVILGVRAKSDALHSSGITQQEYEVYRTYVNEKNFVYEEGTLYSASRTRLDENTLHFIREAGADGYKGDETLLASRDY